MRSHEVLARRQAAVARGVFHVAPIVVERGKGALLYDLEGREYIDFAGGIGVLNVGHNHPRVVQAIQQQSSQLLHACFHVAIYENYVRLAERLNALVPAMGPCKTAFFNSGAEAVENAVKISRAFSKRPAVVAFERGFHGRTLLGMTLTGKCRPYSLGFGPFAPEVYRLPWEPFFAPASMDAATVESRCIHALDHLAQYHVDPPSIACVVIEPVLGEGGFHPVHPAAIGLLRRWTEQHGVVLVVDEVQTGFGRCGAMFASELYGLKADIVTMAKSLAGGMVLSAVTGRADVMDAPDVGGIGGTYGGNPVSCAAALAALDVIEDEDLAERARVLGKQVLGRLADLEARFGIIARPRGLGAMCAVDVVDPATDRPDALRAAKICEAALRRGVILMTASGYVIRTLMPLVITDGQVERALSVLEAAVAEVSSPG